MTYISHFILFFFSYSLNIFSKNISFSIFCYNYIIFHIMIDIIRPSNYFII